MKAVKIALAAAAVAALSYALVHFGADEPEALEAVDMTPAANSTPEGGGDGALPRAEPAEAPK